jgi:hypothetical protein
VEETGPSNAAYLHRAARGEINVIESLTAAAAAAAAESAPSSGAITSLLSTLHGLVRSPRQHQFQTAVGTVVETVRDRHSSEWHEELTAHGVSHTEWLKHVFAMLKSVWAVALLSVTIDRPSVNTFKLIMSVLARVRADSRRCDGSVGGGRGEPLARSPCVNEQHWGRDQLPRSGLVQRAVHRWYVLAHDPTTDLRIHVQIRGAV